MKNTNKTRVSVVAILLSVVSIFIVIQVKCEIKRPKPIVIAVIQSSNDPTYIKPVQRWFLKIYHEAFLRMDINLEYQVLPPKRASLYAEQGVLDGELSRVYDYHTEHSNQIRIEEHHLLSVFSAFSADPTTTLTGWKSLTDTDYKVECRRGIIKCTETLPKFVPAERLSEINSIQDGIRKLLLTRTDVFIDSEDGVFDYLKTEEFRKISKNKNLTIHKVGIMETVTSHLWLHKKHSYLAPQLSIILGDMKEEGLFQLYLEQVELNPELIKW